MTTDRFAPKASRDVADLVLDHPLAWVVSPGDEPRATLLPIRPIRDEAGTVTGLIGHFARRNPQVETLRRDPRAMFLFLGPHGYISPSWMDDRNQAPTWNYASAQFLGEVRWIEDAAGIEALLRDLIESVEAGRPDAWRLDEVASRYQGLARGIIGFRVEVEETRAKFKLGQDERDDVFADILRGLDRSGAEDLAEAMRRQNTRQ